jgi:hypothetical protein
MQEHDFDSRKWPGYKRQGKEPQVQEEPVVDDLPEEVQEEPVLEPDGDTVTIVGADGTVRTRRKFISERDDDWVEGAAIETDGSMEI